MQRTALLAIALTSVGCVPLGTDAGLAATNSPSETSDEAQVPTAFPVPGFSEDVPGGRMRLEEMTAQVKYYEGYKTRSVESVSLKGRVINETDRSCISIDVTLDPLEPSSMNPLVFLHLNLRPGESTVFEEKVAGIFPDIVRELRVASVKPTSSLTYTLHLTSPIESEELAYEDDRIAIKFEVAKRIAFELGNKSDSEPMYVDWDLASFVDMDGRSHRVLHKNVKYSEREQSHPASVVPPGARVNEFAHPADAVEYVDLLQSWVEKPVLPEINSDPSILRGKTFSLFLALRLGADQLTYMFTFRIAEADYAR